MFSNTVTQDYTFTPSEYQLPILQHIESNLDRVKSYISPSGKWIDAPVNFELPNALIQASAGSGKTTLLAECFRQAYLKKIPFNAITCVAFVTKNVDDIRSKFKAMVDPELADDAAKCVRTFNSLGLSLIMGAYKKWNELYPESKCNDSNTHVDNKYKWIIDEFYNRYGFPESICSKTSMLQFVNKLREQVILQPKVDPDTGVNPLMRFSKQYGIRHNCLTHADWESTVEMSKLVLFEGLKRANPYFNSNPTLDLNDQVLVPILMAQSTNKNEKIWYHFKLAIEEWKQKNALFMADEVQDINPVLLRMIRYLSAPHSTTLIVGDSGQNIYRWRGSHSSGMSNLGEDIGAITYDLPISYRLPGGHVSLIKEIWPDRPIKPFHETTGHIHFIAKDSPIKEGAVNSTLMANSPPWLDELEKVIDLPEEKLFIARKNTSVFKLALMLLSKGVLVKTKDLATKARKYAKQVLGYYKSGDTLVFPEDPYDVFALIEQWRDQKIRSLQRKGDSPEAIQEVIDWADALSVIFLGVVGRTKDDESREGLPKDWDEWKKRIDRLNTKKRSTKKFCIVTISTIHSAKGAEAPIVVLIDPDECPLVWANQDKEDKEQEMNALFVALSRAKQTEEPNSGTIVLLTESDSHNLTGWQATVSECLARGIVKPLPFVTDKLI